MKITLLWASTALLRIPAVLAQSTATSAASSCTASLITTLCSYPEPGPDFAVAIDSKASCWEYCNAHPPCNFVIFSAGNPSTGSGTCWLYPGQTFNASAGSSDCGSPSLSVYSQPVCAGGSTATTTSGACTATATPSAIASVCGYPAPGDCFDGCAASASASDCLSQCAKAASCSYAVFNPHNPSNSQYGSGNCWIYPNGTYDAGAVTACSGDPQQFVYNNLCPKPSPSPTPVLSTTTSITGTGTAASFTGTATAGATPGSTTSSKNLAPTALSPTNPLAIGMAILAWHCLE